MRNCVIMLVALAVLAVGTRLAFAEEELFDTKAAAMSLEKGVAHLKTKEYDAAIKELEESVSINPDAEGFYYLGYAYYLKGKTGDGDSRQKSIDCFEKAYELDPNFTPTKYKPAEQPTVAPQQQNAQESPAPSVAPAQPAAPDAAVQSQQTQEPDAPAQPAAPVKATEKVKNIGDIPAVP